MKGQTSIIAIVIAVIMIVFIMLFLLSTTLSEQISQDVKTEYRNLYVTNLLLSVLNTDTDCGTFLEMIKAHYFVGLQCTPDEFSEKLDSHVSNVLKATGNTDYYWLLETEPKFSSSVQTLQWGNNLDVTAKPGYWDARTLISWRSQQIEVKLYIRND